MKKLGYFDYPLDTKSLLRKKIIIKKELLSANSSWIEKKVAVLGGSTTNEVVDQVELFLLFHGIKAEFYQSEFGLYWEDALFGNPKLDDFHPDIVYIHTNWRNITSFPNMKCTLDDSNSLLENEFHRYESMWEALKKRYNCIIIQNNFDRPNYRLLGNRDIWDYRGRSNFIARLNQKIYEYASMQDAFYINDIDYIAGEYGIIEWNNSLYWNMYKYVCPLNAIPLIAQSVANIIKSIYGRNKKILTLDLDNTLWGGVIGDDGIAGIKIGAEIPKGQSYYEFQSYVKNLQSIGIILAVNSKNEEENALEGLSHPDGILRKEDFVSIKANWNTKDQNLREIADELSLGFDSFVFVDDNPAEREIVSARFPMVSVPQMDGPENYIKILDNNGYFETTVFSNEDIQKTESYRARATAIHEKSKYFNYDEYLKSLEMRAAVTEFEPIFVQRIAQLTNKTNQFNLTHIRCSESDIQKMQDNPSYICLCARLIDKYGDNGIVTVVAGEIVNDELHIRLWLMSCRVFKRSLEDLMMNILVDRAKQSDVKGIFGYYFSTAKNSMVKDFYSKYGYQLVSTNEQGNRIFHLAIDDYQNVGTNIDVV